VTVFAQIGAASRYFQILHIDAPHGWEAGIVYDETTKTLLCGDLFTPTGSPAATTTEDIIGPAIAAEDISTRHPGPVERCHRAPLGRVRRGHARADAGPAFTGDCRSALADLAADFDRRIAEAAASAIGLHQEARETSRQAAHR